MPDCIVQGRSAFDRVSFGRIAVVAASVVIVACPSAHAAGSVLRTCGADPVANTTSVLCANPSGPCTATTVALSANIDVRSGGCTFDLGGRALAVTKTFQMTGAGFIKVINAGDVAIASTGKLKSRGDFVLATATPTPMTTPTPTLLPSGATKAPTPSPTQTFVATGPPGTIQGGLISIISSGTITHTGIIDVSGDSAGTVVLDAVHDVLLQSGSLIQGNGIASSADAGNADGGTLQVISHAGGITDTGAISMVGDSQAMGGEVDLTAARDIDVQELIDASGGGGDGGCIDFEAGDDINVTKTLTVDSSVGAGFGGNIVLNAGDDTLGGIAVGGSVTVNGATLRLNGSDAQASSGDGGELDASAAGPIRFLGAALTIRADGGNLFDGSGGTVCLDSGDADGNRIGPLDGDITVEGQVLLQSAGQSGSGGFFEVSAGRSLTLNATVDTSGADDGGQILVDAGGAIAVNGAVTAQGRTGLALPGSVDFTAGEAQDAGLTVSQNILANGGANNATGDLISLAGCALTVAGGIKVNGQGGMNALGTSGSSEIDLVARHPMQLGAAAQFLANPGGTIFTIHPPGQNPVIGAGVVFNPARTDSATVNGPYPNCPVCGDGIRQLGEVCDNGAAADGACCNATCTAFTCPTPTTTVTAVPTHTATRTVTPIATPTRIPTPTVTAIAMPTGTTTAPPRATATPTPLSSRTSVATASATRTATAAATATASPVPSRSPTTATATPSTTPTRSATPTNTASVTATAIRSATRTATPTPSATPALSRTATPTVASPSATPHLTPGTPAATPTPGFRIGKSVAACQHAIARAGSVFAAKKLESLGRCLDTVLHCLQETPDDPACLPAATVICRDEFIGGLGMLHMDFRATIAKKCAGPALTAGELLGADGLGYDSLAAECLARFATTADDLDGITECVLRQHECETELLFATQLPRAGELLARINAVLPVPMLCLPNHGDGGTLGHPLLGEALDDCVTEVEKAGSAFAVLELRSIGRCVDAVLKCETSPVRTTCLGAANATCTKALAKSTTAAGAIAGMIDTDCNEASIELALLRSANGANLDALAGECAAFGVPSLATLADYELCVLRQHSCHTEELLRFEVPRIEELLGALSPPVTLRSGFCPLLPLPPR